MLRRLIDHILKIYLKMLVWALQIINYYQLLLLFMHIAHVEDAIVTHLYFDWKKQKRILLVYRYEDPHTPRLHFAFIFISRALRPCDQYSPISVWNQSTTLEAFMHLGMADLMVSKRTLTLDSFVYSKGKHAFLGRKTLKIT